MAPHHLPGLPVAVPGPAEPAPPRPAHDGDDEQAFDWRVTAAIFALLWAAFTSLVMSVAPPTWGGVVAWFIATAAMGGEVLRQRHLWQRHVDALAVPSPLASLEAGEQRPASVDVDGVEEGLDEDPA